MIFAPSFNFGVFNLAKSTSGKTRRFTGCWVFILLAKPRAGSAPSALRSSSVMWLYSLVMQTPQTLQKVLLRTWRPKLYLPIWEGSLAKRTTRSLPG